MIKEITEEEMKEAMLSVRNAHRLLYAYQRRIMDTAKYMQTKLGITSPLSGNSVLFAPIKKVGYSHKYGQQKLEDIWAWDFIPSLCYEYYLRRKNVGKYYCRTSLIQVSDSGYFESSIENKHLCSLDTYNCTEDSSTDFFIFFEAALQDDEERIWSSREFVLPTIEHYYKGELNGCDCKACSEYIVRSGKNGSLFLMRKYSASHLANEQSVDKILSDLDEQLREALKISILDK